MATGPQTIAEGSLADTPFAHVLVSIERRALTGTLAVWPDDETRGQDRLLFNQGRAVAGRLLAPAASLEAGLLPLFRRASAPYAFYAENLLGDAPGIVKGSVRTGALIASSLRESVRDDIVDRILAGHGESPVRVAIGADLAELALTPNERAIVELVQADPSPVEHIVSVSGDPKVARRVLYLLALTKKLEPLEGRVSSVPRVDAGAPAAGRFTAVPEPPPAAAPRISPEPPAPRISPEPPAPPRKSAPGEAPGSGGPPRPPAPPAGLAPELAARWKEIADFVVASDEWNYFQLLGLGEAASNDEINAAYAQRVKLVHPDRLGPELAALAPYAQKLFHQLTEAKKALLDADARLAHVRAIRSGGGTPVHDRKLSAIVGAAMDFQKVDVLVKQRKYDEALAILERVLAIEPTEPDYLARKAWTLFLVHPDKTGPRVAEMLALCDKALSKNEKHEQAHFTKASVLKRQGNDKAALDHFRLALKANPKNIDAARELRIAEMRAKNAKGGSNPPGPKAGGETSLLKKLFGGSGTSKDK